VWKFFASVRLTVIVLLTLAGTSIIGTLIPQNASPGDYFQKYGEFWYRLFYGLGIFDMYHSWWFRTLLLILTVNIIVCSIERLSATWKIIFKEPSFNLPKFKNLPYKEEFTADYAGNNLKEKYESFVAKHYRYSKTEATESGFCIFAEKGRWTRLGVYIVHVSVIFLLIGGLIGSIFGFEGFVNIPEGEKRNQIRLRKTLEPRTLDFEIQCDKFHVSFYNTGAPKEYRSELTILENGKPMKKKSIIVNDPLRYRGINIFQSSYGTIVPDAGALKGKEIEISITGKETGLVYNKKVIFGGEAIELPEGLGKFAVKNFQEHYDFMGHDLGETFIGELTHPEEKPVEIAMPLGHPNFDKMRRGKVTVTVTDYPYIYYTGLQITKDPGVLIVYFGFIVMIIGIFITFFTSHESIFLEVSETDKKYRVRLSGGANKNKIGMEIKVRKLAKGLKKDFSTV